MNIIEMSCPIYFENNFKHKHIESVTEGEK